MRRLVRFILHTGAWLEEQIAPTRGLDGITPARITVLTGDRKDRRLERRRRA
jgi:hypothetical protein